MAKNITLTDFERMFRFAPGTLPGFIKEELSKIDTSYHQADAAELAEYILQYLQQIDKPWLVRNKAENLAAFEKGWSENYQKMVTEGISLNALKPGYFRENKFLRYDNGLIVPANHQLEFDLFKVARYCVFDKYLRNAEAVVELGCGSCQNLLMLADFFKHIKIFGADWTQASIKTADFLAKKLNRDIVGFHLDMLEPQKDIQLPSGAALLTIHAFEQLGRGYGPILKYIFESKPSIVVHYEPIIELFTEDNLLDFMAIRYFHKRNYLQCYLSSLHELEKRGIIEIIEEYRPFLGGVLHDSSIIVWRPVGQLPDEFAV